MLKMNMEKTPPINMYQMKIYLVEGISGPIRIVSDKNTRLLEIFNNSVGMRNECVGHMNK